VNEALALYNMANIHQHAGERELAAGYIAEALQLLRDSGVTGMSGYLRIHIATTMAETASAEGRQGASRGPAPP
jgi:hypothetical protein